MGKWSEQVQLCAAGMQAIPLDEHGRLSRTAFDLWISECEKIAERAEQTSPDQPPLGALRREFIGDLRTVLLAIVANDQNDVHYREALRLLEQR